MGDENIIALAYKALNSRCLPMWSCSASIANRPPSTELKEILTVSQQHIIYISEHALRVTHVKSHELDVVL